MNLFEATASLTLNINEYEKNVKEAIKQAQKLSETLAGTSTRSQVASRNFHSLTETLSRIVSGNKQTNSSTEQVTRSISDSGSSAETASRKFSLFGASVKDSSGNVSLFGEMLKANIISDAISKGFDMIVDGFKRVGSAAVGFMKNAVNAGQNFDSAMSQVAATMGKSVDEIQNLRDFAQQMGATTKYSATESAQALNYMALAGYDAETSMKMLPNVMNLASAGAFDLARASDMLTDTQTAFGISLERTNQLVDEMAKAASTGNTSVAQLGDAFLTIGGLAKELNGGMVQLADGTQKDIDGVQELEIALVSMANAGIKGSEAGTHMRNMLLKLSAPTEDATKFFEQYGIQIFDTAGNMNSLRDIFAQLNTQLSSMTQGDKLAAISDIFNARDTASAEALLAAVGQNWDKIGDAIVHAEGAASKMAQTQIKNLEGWKTLRDSAKEGLQIKISDALKPVLTDFVKWQGESLQLLTDTLAKDGITNLPKSIKKIMTNAGKTIRKNVPDLVKNALRVLTYIQEGIEPLKSAIGETVEKVQRNIDVLLPKFIKSGLKIISNLGKGIANNAPKVIPFVTDTVLTIVEALTNPESNAEMTDSGLSLLKALGDGIKNSIPIVEEKIPIIIENIKESFSRNKEKLEESAISLITFLAESLKEKANAIKEKAPEIMQTVADKLKNAVPDMLETGKEIIKKLGDSILNADIPIVDKVAIEKKLATLFEKFDTVKMNLEIAVKDVPDEVKKQWDTFTTTLSESFDRVKTAWNNLKTTLNIDEFWESGKVGEQTGKALSTAIEGLGATITVTADSISRAVTGIIDVFNWLIDDKKASALKNTLGAIVGGIVAVNTAIAGATFIGMLSNLPALISGVTGAFSGLWAVMLSNPVLVVVGAIGAIVGALITAYNTNEEFRKKVDETFKTFKESWDKITTGENGTITNIKKFNKDLEDFGAGVYDVVQNIKGYFEYLVDEWAKTWEKVDKFGEDADNFISGIEDSITEFVEKAKQWGKDFVDNIISGIDEKINPLHDAGMKIGETLYNLLHHSTPEEGYLKDDDKWMSDMMDNFSNGIQNNIHLVTEKTENLAGRIKSGFDGIISSAWNWGSDIITNFIDGANSLWDSWVGTWEDFGGVIYDLLHHSTPEKGLLKNDDEWMPDMMYNFISGIRDNIPALQQQAETAVSAIQTAFSSPVEMGDIEEISIPELTKLEYGESGLEYNTSQNVEIHTSLIDTVSRKLDEIGNRIIDVVVNGKFHGFDIPEIPEISIDVIRNQDEFKPEDKTVNIFTNFVDTVSRKLDEIGQRVIEIPVNSRFNAGEIPQLPDFETEDIQIEVTFLDNLAELLEKFRSFKNSASNTVFDLNGNLENIDIPAIDLEIPDFEKLAERKPSIETTEIRNFREIYQNEEYYTRAFETDRKAPYRPQQQPTKNNNSDDMQAVIGLLNGILTALQEREIVMPIDTLDTALGLKQSNETRWAMA